MIFEPCFDAMLLFCYDNTFNVSIMGKFFSSSDLLLTICIIHFMHVEIVFEFSIW